MLRKIALLGAALAAAKASVIDSALLGSEAVLGSLSATGSPHLEIHEDHFDTENQRQRRLCVLHPRGGDNLDDDNFKRAFDECGRGGIIRLPDAN